MNQQLTFADSEFNNRRRQTREKKSRLCIYCMQQWYSRSGPSMGSALYDVATTRLLADPSPDKAIPDNTTILQFHQLLEQHGLARQIFEELNQRLSEADVLLEDGSLVDTTIIEASRSTKNKVGEQNRFVGPHEMHQTQKVINGVSA